MSNWIDELLAKKAQDHASEIAWKEANAETTRSVWEETRTRLKETIEDFNGRLSRAYIPAVDVTDEGPRTVIRAGEYEAVIEFQRPAIAVSVTSAASRPGQQRRDAWGYSIEAFGSKLAPTIMCQLLTYGPEPEVLTTLTGRETIDDLVRLILKPILEKY